MPTVCVLHADHHFRNQADHGMSSRGNHGDGHPDNTRTPLVAWGAGVAQSEERTEHEAVEDDEADWHLSHLRRKDIEQAGVAPLIVRLPLPLVQIYRLLVTDLDIFLCLEHASWKQYTR